MKRQFGFAAAAVGALVLLSQGAEAGPWHHHHAYKDKRVAVAGAVVGLGATATFLSLNNWSFNGNFNSVRSGGLTTGAAAVGTTVGCAAIAPMVATVVVNRPLTMREGHTLISGCFLPIIGPWIVSSAYDAHPEWEGAAAAPARRHRHHRR